MSEVTITEARSQLSHLVDVAHSAPVYLTRRGHAAAAIVDADELRKLQDAAEELADIRSVDEAWNETQELGETPIPWDEVKRDLGLV